MPASGRGTSSCLPRSPRRPWRSHVAAVDARPSDPHQHHIGSAGAAAAAFYRMLVPLTVDDVTLLGERQSERARAALEREKALVLRSIKELEFDRAMGKVSPQRLRRDVEPAASSRDDAHQAGRRRWRRLPRADRTRIECEAGHASSGRAAEPRANVDRRRQRSWSRSGPAEPRLRVLPASLRRVRHRQRSRRRVLQALRRTPRCGDGDDALVSCTSAALSRVLVLAAGFCAPAAAQPFAGGMPDPKQMSGRPLPVGDLPVGTVTVRVVRGSMTNVVANQAVELTGAGAP